MNRAAQSLAKGAAGLALLRIEQAATGQGSWQNVHAHLAEALHGGVSAGPGMGLFYGAPAAAYAVHSATIGPGSYQRAIQALDEAVATTTRARLTAAHARIDRGLTPEFAEYDLLYGLTGLGAHLLRHHHDGELLRDVLAYLVRLTDPLPNGLPGWWTHLAPSGERSSEYLGGHGNLGLAHGISGPLALLALATRHGVTVLGQPVAIRRILTWLDAWRQDGPTGAWWPEAVTRQEEAARRTRQRGPLRPSWCYGTPGLARAQQLAALALADTARQQLAETAVLGCLTDPAQLGRLPDDGGLCHGTAGLYQTVWRIAQDSTNAAFAQHLAALAALLPEPDEDLAGLLDGTTGTALARSTASTGTALSGWDSCLLLN
ncbi:lanthionine synthetase C family protein [Streptomyces rubellomurinus]|uniref:lanthionine synthetase C family protein n=1 Tax=Streptomyces rubellomurinus (strain ATCC 31215) TaxID=359131 RepID=UPI0006977CCD|nr:lanthionine synthetase C family protein [Streptomyces rubellomurinus]